LFAVRREPGFGEAAVHRDDPVDRLPAVGRDPDVDLLRLPTVHGVELAVVLEREGAVLRAGQEANRVLAEAGDLTRLVGMVYSALPDVVGAALLAQVVELVVVGAEHRVTVFAFEAREPGVLLRRHVVDPDVAGDGGDVVLTPVALVTVVVVEDELG